MSQDLRLPLGARAPRIRRADAMAVSIPLRKPMRMAGVRLTHAENLLVRIEAEDGSVGWGEAASAPTMTGDLQGSMLTAATQVFCPLLGGQNPLDRVGLMTRVDRAMLRNTGAKCAVEEALLDLCGRLLKVPVYELLGGARRDVVRPMHLLGNDSVEDDVDEAKARRADGVDFFKIKVGVKPLSEEVRSTRLLREALGWDVVLCADGNMGLDAQDVLDYCAQVADQKLLFLEQPLRSDDLRGMARLAARVSIPMCADESVGSAADVMALAEAQAVAGVNLKTIKFGGLSAVVHASHLCEQLGLHINLACKVGESSIGCAGLAQLGAVMCNLDWGINLTNHYLADDLVVTPLLPTGGALAIPSGPGLGIEVDEAKIDRYRVR
ncbi:L-Ala-D/L-Glu epimerase [Variovorax sp. PBL-H6]|uniref:mandelate racemase/muconate lactonizing enzyme family protein n=1 Tax=Variovorax sp. PBL-H6 TaxID=434009 RepID=UPI001315EFB3|nr:enolase C-terminal domain-like protein [Variovorax sp. PBL-H6]VTU16221.1 L-Ala-D/L-Glu epimerase [Variovorax sp. PBL-H6]